ncbi:MAG TPA: sigma-54 dependent transcriptional regulator [Candidatus Thiothrix moscowensis]|uniref:sigma-54-dependent transcriptional regulator n=1 Tax=unclassified Thiothrix TaxID=2636184 RepID=UPI0025F0F335|nr:MULTISPECIES: sigma-54 dependent transcriptional regulator [unclassified Thiothrix]HRJ51750.1 sigma-54 dependent transcriptional regulator [Candidatus Thiothrix moscowensis]HRJ92065.1 sigma-54 dependent transcriptional regulator [Candidatus Thiothrix moscowensis]
METPRPAVLLLDDEIRSVESMARILGEEFEVHTAFRAQQALELLEEQHIQVILADQRMPEMTGVEFLTRVRAQYPDIVRMIISGYTDPEDIIEGVNAAGIYQYISKPWHPDNLLLTVRNAARLYQLQRENAALSLELKLSEQHLLERTQQHRRRLQHSFHLDNIVRAADSGLNSALQLVEKVAPYDVSVLISGESGTGKELFARALHYNSQRADKPFVVENCGALPDALLESELFGHKRGAFTGAVADHIGLFEQAHLGTIFLDEIGETSPAFQIKLLRVLQDGSFRPVGSSQRRYANVRVIAATNRDLLEEVRMGRFREDLYYRLAGVTIHLPPLRERRMDIAPLANFLLQRSSQQMGKPARGFTPQALHALQGYGWPGNVRELHNEVQRMLVMATDTTLDMAALSPHIQFGNTTALTETSSSVHPLFNIPGTLKERVEALEIHIVRAALDRHHGNKSRAAEELGLSRVGLRNKLERYGIAGTDD